jgi:hypothetical protein
VRTVLVAISVVAVAGLAACGAKPCKDLAKKACEAAPDSAACEAAIRMTNNDECAGYLKDVNRYVELKNQKVTGAGVKPPAPPAPAPEAAPAAEGAAPAEAAPAPAPAPAAAQ